MTRLAIAACVLLLTACARGPSLADLEREGQSALRNDDLPAAWDRADAGARIAGERHDAAWQPRFRVLQAEVLVEQQRAPTALKLIGDAELPPGGADLLNVRLLIARGRAHCAPNVGAIDAGRHDLDEAGRLVAALPPGDLAGRLTLYRGNCALTDGDLPLADRLFREALATARQLKSTLLESKAAGSVGITAMQGRRYDEAFTWLDRALSMPTTNFVRAKSMVNLGWCQYALGDFERALSILTEAEALARAGGYAAPRQRALELMGNAHYRLHDLKGAADAFGQSLLLARAQNDERSTAELLANLAIVAFDQRQLDAAHTLNAESLQIKKGMKNPDGPIQHSLFTEGRIRAASGDAAGAEGYYRQVLASPAADRDLQWEVRAELAQLRMKAGQPAEADAEFHRAFEIIEQSAAEVQRTEHKLSFYSSIDQFHDAYVDLLVERGDMRRALEVADRSRAQLLREKLQEGLPAQALTAAQFQQAAAARNAVILFYWLAPTRSFVWTVSRDGIALNTLPGEDAITAHVDAYRRLILRSGDPRAEETTDARWLYDTLVQPVRASVPPESRVVFVPDGALHQLNPETLLAGDPSPHYWIEDVTLSIAPSISVLASKPRASSGSDVSRGILVIGDPLPSGREFPRLAHASSEVAGIRDQFAPDARTVFVGAQADRRAYLESGPGRYAFIHFAAHGIANREAPLDSAVVLSPTDDASKLYARDILRVPIRADLVTISACSGAGSRTYAGEGLVGLTWAFLTSGARNVIAALWNVDDASTASLMEGLYKRVAHGAAPADALRQSKLALIGSSTAFRKPFYWAPFLTYTGTAAAPAADIRAAR